MSLTDAQNEADEIDIAADDEWFELQPDDTDPVTINRALLGLGYAQRDLADFEATTASEFARLDERYERAKREILARHKRGAAPLVAKVDRYRQYLESQMSRMHSADPKRTKVTYSAGTLATRDPGVEWDWTDDEALLAFCQTHWPELVETPEPKPRVKKAELKKLAKAATLTKDRDGTTVPISPDGFVMLDDGITVPGVQVVPKRRVFTVDTDPAVRDDDLEPF